MFSTRELPDLSLSIRVKTEENYTKPFSDDKLFLSIANALSHKKDHLEPSRELTNTVIAKLLPFKSSTISRTEIIATTYEVIRRFDTAAAVYYKSHHPVK